MKSLSLFFTVVVTVLSFLLVVSSNKMVSALDLVEIGTVEDYERIALGDEHHAALIFFYANWDRENRHLKHIFQETAEKMTHDHISGLVLGMVDAGRHPKVAKAVGVTGLPALLLYQYGTGARRWSGSYHDSDFNVENIITFAVAEANIHRDKLQKIRDAHAEKERTHYDFPHPNPGTVVELDARNFNRVVRDPTKVAFVMYYADWCEICKQTMPAVEQLAKYYESTGRVVIARMEVDNNQEWLEQNGVELEGVPTFFLYPRGRRDKEKGWQYVGDREFEEMSVYVNGHNKKDEEDIHEFHAAVIRNKPDDHMLPDHMKGVKIKESDAMPRDIFDEDGRPYGDGPTNVKHPVHPLKKDSDGRTPSNPRYDGHHHKTEADKFDEETSGLTVAEKEQLRLRRLKQKHRIDAGANPLGSSGALPPELKGKI